MVNWFHRVVLASIVFNFVRLWSWRIVVLGARWESTSTVTGVQIERLIIAQELLRSRPGLISFMAVPQVSVPHRKKWQWGNIPLRDLLSVCIHTAGVSLFTSSYLLETNPVFSFKTLRSPWEQLSSVYWNSVLFVLCECYLCAVQRKGSRILFSFTLASGRSCGLSAEAWSPLALRGLVLDTQWQSVTFSMKGATIKQWLYYGKTS